MKYKNIAFSLCLVLIVSACGGGGGSSPNADSSAADNPSVSNGNPQTSTPAITATFVRYFTDANKHLFGVKDASPDQPNDITSAVVDASRQLFQSTGTTLTPNKIFVNTEGKHYTFDIGGTGARTQVSSATTSLVCALKTFSAAQSHIFYTDGGVAGDCVGATRYWYISTNGNDTIAPVAVPGFPLTLITENTGSGTGWLFATANGIERYDTNLQSIATVNNATYTSAKEGDGIVFLMSNTEIAPYNLSNNSIGTALFSFSTSIRSLKQDDTHLYLVENEKNIYRIPNDGSTNAVLVGNEPSGTILQIRNLSGNLIVYEAMIGGNLAIKTMDITNGQLNTLVDEAVIAGSVSFVGYSQNRIFFNTLTGNMATAFAINADGSNQASTANTLWAGMKLNNTYNLNDAVFEAENLIKIVNIDGADLNSAQLRVYSGDGVSQVRTLGTLPDGIPLSVAYNWTSFQPEGLVITSISGQIDLLYFNVNATDSLIRVTNDTGIETRI